MFRCGVGGAHDRGQAGKCFEQRLGLRRALENECLGFRGEQRQVTGKLNGIAQALFAVDEQRLARSRCFVPLGFVLVPSVFLCRASAPLVVFPTTGEVALEQLQQAESVVGIGQLGVQLDRLGKMFTGFIESPCIDECPGEVGVVTGIGRLGGDGALEAVDRLVGLLGGLLNCAESVVGGGCAGVKLPRLEGELQRLGNAVLPQQHGGEIAVRLGQGRFQRQGMEVSRLSLAGPAGLLEEIAEVHVSLGQGGTRVDCHPKGPGHRRCRFP